MAKDNAKPRNAQPVRIINGLLVCPHCDGTYMHQTSAEVYENPEVIKREYGYVPQVLEVDLYKATAHVSVCPRPNPSEERQAMRIAFRCENCTEQMGLGHPILEITQYKGCTQMKWCAENG